MKFRNPPVVETVLSVQFKPINKIGAGLLGKFWSSLDDDWKVPLDAPALELEHEQFGPENAWQSSGLRFKVGPQVDLRLQIFNSAGDRMIQVQNGRFLFNWIGVGRSYPSYDVVRPQFDKYWDQFREFLVTYSDQSFDVDQWEVVYVNHIPICDPWATTSELPNLFTFLSPIDHKESDVNLEAVNGEWQYEIPDIRGRLYARLGRTLKEDIPHIVFTLTARGAVATESGATLDDGLSLGHDTITKAFCELTTPEAQKLWNTNHAKS